MIDNQQPMNQNPTPGVKKAFWGYLAIIGIIGAFVLGMYVGKGRAQGSQTTFTNTQTQSSQIDFSLFWDVYKKLEEKYVDRPLDKQKILYGAIDGMVKSTGDPYTAFMNPTDSKDFQSEISGSFEGIGVEIGMKDGFIAIVAPIKDSPGDKAGLQAGDYIAKIDDKSTIDMSLNDAVHLIRGEKGTKVHLTIQRGTEKNPREFDITRDTISVKSVESKMLADGVFLIKLSRFSEDSKIEFDKAIDEFNKQGGKKIVLDLRNNPGGLLDVAVDIASEFIENKTIVIEEFSKDKRNSYPANGKARLKDIPVIVLANEGSASASEILAGALRDDLQVKIVGVKTFGKGSVQELENLKDGSSMRVTIAKWLTPNGTSIHKNGLVPDVEIPLSEDDMKNNKDPQLDKAVEMLK